MASAWVRTGRGIRPAGRRGAMVNLVGTDTSAGSGGSGDDGDGELAGFNGGAEAAAALAAPREGLQALSEAEGLAVSGVTMKIGRRPTMEATRIWRGGGGATAIWRHGGFGGERRHVEGRSVLPLMAARAVLAGEAEVRYKETRGSRGFGEAKGQATRYRLVCWRWRHGAGGAVFVYERSHRDGQRGSFLGV